MFGLQRALAAWTLVVSMTTMAGPARAEADATGLAAVEEQAVMALTQAACDAVRGGDVAAIRRLLAPEFVLVGSDASVQTLDDLLTEMRRGDPVYEVFRNHSMHARLYGDAAIVQGITSLKGSAAGQAFALDVRFTDTLIRRDGRWQMVVSHVTRLPSP